MRGRHFPGKGRLLPARGYWVTGALLAAFFVGAVAGSFLAACASGEGLDALAASVYACLSFAAKGQTNIALLRVLWHTVRWPLLAAAVSLLVPYRACILLLFAARGFLLSFAVSSFVRLYGTPGLSVAFVLFGLTGLLTLPSFFHVGACCIAPEQAAARPVLRGLPRIFKCVPALSLAIPAELFAVPFLAGRMADMFRLL